MRVLRRDTLEWEEIEVKGKNEREFWKFNNGTKIDFMNALAVEGTPNFKGLGVCSDCGKIMTKRQFEKHIKKTASIENCTGCYYLSYKDAKLVKKNGEYEYKAKCYCRHESAYLTPDLACTNGVCRGTFSKHISIGKCKIPSKILTIKAFMNEKWLLTGKRSEKELIFKHYKYNLEAYVDRNGYFVRFEYKNDRCYYDLERDMLINKYGGSVTTNNTILNVCRRLYED